ncbi:DUF1990 domain-containing protein [Singulisphaera sp. Ch08]|uniref:DUF1990 domain-containing protein n=1 Tax=Singulisphaera sp. Ch08 TaxID=3120278 RepID=A0AAU7C8V9_9BACT
MISLRKPSAESIRDFLATQSKLDFTYQAVGATAGDLFPEGYILDHTRVKLGEGEEVFSRAQRALKDWTQFRLGWVEAWAPPSPLQVDEVVGVVARVLGVWWLNACRVVYIVDEQHPVQRYGFAYGTLPHHAGTGEERFLIEWDRASGAVWYDILAFSRPRGILARLGYPYMRTVQRRFGKASAAAMIAATNNPEPA